MKCLKRVALGAASLVVCGCAVQNVQWGSPASDTSTDVVVDSLGNAFVAYVTTVGGTFPYVRKMNASGSLIGTIVLEPTGFYTNPQIALNPDGTRLYVVMQGPNNVALVHAYDSQGNFVAMRSLTGVRLVRDISVATDGTVFFAWANGGQSFFTTFTPELVVKHDSERINAQGVANDIVALTPFTEGDMLGIGNSLRTSGDSQFVIRLIRDAQTYSQLIVEFTIPGAGVTATAADIAVSSGTLYMTGTRSLGTAASTQAFLSIWPRNTATPLAPVIWGGPAADSATSVGVDAQGYIYVGGSTYASADKNVDLFVTRFDPTGKLLQTVNWGSPEIDITSTGVIGPTGKGYLVGGTLGALNGPNQGYDDAFLSIVTP